MGSELDYESYAEDDMTDSEDEFHDCESDGQSLPPPKNEVNIFLHSKLNLFLYAITFGQILTHIDYSPSISGQT